VLLLAAVGDVMLARSVGARIERDGPDVVFDGVAEVLRAADISVGNLESALSDLGEPAEKGYAFRAPPAAADALVDAGIDLVSLANNHSLDYGREALLDTLTRLGAARIASVGAGPNGVAARRPAVLERNGLRVAFLAYVDVPPDGSFSRGTWEATEARPGVAWLDLATLGDDIRVARAVADVVVVMLHFGREFATEPTAAQWTAARFAVDAGAALVLGSHPHMLQEVERYGEGVIAYSVGNFVFDGFDGPSNETAILMADLTVKGVETWQLIPVAVVDGLPELR
jgi:poly-gamma-glutamate capsule biosynthesis protein CapA/YwtB (metallophosphatase superfamily)